MLRPVHRLLVALVLLVLVVPLAPPARASTHDQSRFSGTIENGKTTILFRPCGQGSSYRFRVEMIAPNQLLWDQTYGAINGCLPYTYRAVVNSMPGSKFRIYSMVMDSPLTNDEFLQRAQRHFIEVTAPGAIRVTPETVTVPRAAIDTPAAGQTVQGTLNVGGWAVDLASMNGSGVNEIHVYAGERGLGAATYGQARPDLAALFKDSRFTNAQYQFSFDSRLLPNGPVNLRVAARSTVSGQWTWTERPIVINNTVDPQPDPTPPPPPPAEHTIWGIVENNKTTVLLRACGTGPTHMFRAEKPGAWGSELFVRSASGDCSPTKPYGWRVVLNASPGEQFRIWSLLGSSAVGAEAFAQQAVRRLCTVTALGQVSCQNDNGAVVRPEEPKQTGGVLNVPYVDQVYVQQRPANSWWTLCGPSSVAMALGYYGKESRNVTTDRAATRDLISTIMVNGTEASVASWQGIARAMRSRGLEVTSQYGISLQQIRDSINAGHPIIAGIAGANHIVTIVGLKDNDTVVVNDPFGGKFWWRDPQGVRSQLRNDVPWGTFSSPRTKGRAVEYRYNEISFANTARAGGQAPGATLEAGAGSSRQNLFQAAYNRNGGVAAFGNPANMVHPWSAAHALKTQDFFNTPAGHRILTHDEARDSPGGTIPAYNIHGGILMHWDRLGGPGSWLGVPTSDEFANAAGRAQVNFENGYIDWNNGRPFAVAWPAARDDQWRVAYRNRAPGGSNEPVGGATWVETRDGNMLDLKWGNNAPNGGRSGVWADNFSVVAERNVTFEPGSYKLTMNGDDGFRLFINGEKRIDSWNGTGYKELTLDLSGRTNLRAEYYELGGGADLKLVWQKVGSSAPPTGSKDELCKPLDAPVLLVSGITNDTGSHMETFRDWITEPNGIEKGATVDKRCVRIVTSVRTTEGQGWRDAANLTRFIEEVKALRSATGADRISIVGFSQGGLQARAYIENNEGLYGDDVAYLITMGTPHKGAVTGWFTEVRDQFGKAYDSLAPNALKKWNSEHTQPPKVKYYFVAGANDGITNVWNKYLPIFKYKLDGIVDVDSAWGGYASGKDVVRLIGGGVGKVGLTSDCHSENKNCDPQTLYYKNRALFNEFISPVLKGEQPSKLDFKSPKTRTIGSDISLPPSSEQPLASTYIDGGEVQSYTLMLDGGARDPRFLLLTGDPRVTLQLRDPQGNLVDAPGSPWNYAPIELPDAGLRLGYAITGTATGNWTLVVSADPTLDEPVAFDARALFETPITLEAQTVKSVVQANEPVTVTARVTAAPANAQVTATVAVGEGQPLATTALYDDGKHGDGAAGDGLFGGALPGIGAAGAYKLDVALVAGDVRRPTTLDLEVSEGQALFGGVALAAMSRSTQPRGVSGEVASSDALTLTVDIAVKERSQYIVVGELVDEQGQPISYARFGAVLDKGTQAVNLMFEGKHLADGTHKRLTLRRVQLFEDTGELVLADEQLDSYQVRAGASTGVFLPVVTR
jgi:pimeloyl-ACP methyl ester carboxylesterase